MLFGKDKNKLNKNAGSDDISQSISDPDAFDFFGSGADESDWKPFVQYADEEAALNGFIDDEEEETAFFKEIKETGAESDEEEDKAEQYAFDGQDSAGLSEGEARYDGGGGEATEGYTDFEADKLLGDGSDAEAGGREAESGSGAEGSGDGSKGRAEERREEIDVAEAEKPVEAEAETDKIAQAETEKEIEIETETETEEVPVTPIAADDLPGDPDPDFDPDDNPFEHDQDIESINPETLNWKRKNLRLTSEKKGIRIIADDDVLTAVESDYIDKEEFLRRKNEPEEPDDIDDEILSDSTGHSAPADTIPALNEDIVFPEIDDTEVKVDTAILNSIFDKNEAPAALLWQTGTETDAASQEADAESVPAQEETQQDESTYYDDVFEDDPEKIRKSRTRRKILYIVKEVFKDILIFILVFAIVIMGYLTYSVYISRTNNVIGTSMEPTLHEGDKVRSSMMPYVFGKPEVGDIVIINVDRIGKGFNYFERIGDVLKANDWISKTFFKGTPADTMFIKRVVAVPGDLIEFKDDHFYRNGELVTESYLNEQNVFNYPNGTSLVIPEGYIYVMGDNRNVSYDSRSSDIGMIPIYTIAGKV